MANTKTNNCVAIPIPKGLLEGFLTVPADALGVAVFAHGSGSSRHSRRNQFVAEELNEAGLATLLFDLLLPAEHQVDVFTRQYRFDIGRLAQRMVLAIDWLRQQQETSHLPMGLFGASTGAAAALIAAAERPNSVGAIVSRGGRPDLAGEDLTRVKAPTLLIVGGLDGQVLALNQQADQQLANSQIAVVPGATHLFEEPGKLEEVAQLAVEWFIQNLQRR